MFISYGKSEHSLPVQNDLLQLFAIPAKWFILANFCFECKNLYFKISHYILDINYGSISKQDKLWKKSGCSLGQRFLKQHDGGMNLPVQGLFYLPIIIF